MKGLLNEAKFEIVNNYMDANVIVINMCSVKTPAYRKAVKAISIAKELRDSKNVLQRYTAQTVNWLAYPFGSFNQRVANLASQAGYIGALSTYNGLIQNTNRIFTIPRVRINGGEDLASFASKLPWKD